MNRGAMVKRSLPFLAAILIALSACSGGAPAEPPPLAGAAIGGDFTLVDKAGHTVRWADFRGRWVAIYFGYTFCPDACPTDVGVLMRGYARFAKNSPAAAAKLQPLFVSIDPERDTPAKVGEFAAAFSPRLTGLTGTRVEVDRAVKAFRVYAVKGPTTAGGYLMDHSRIAYLFDPAGKPIDMLPVDKGPDAVAATLAKWVR